MNVGIFFSNNNVLQKYYENSAFVFSKIIGKNSSRISPEIYTEDGDVVRYILAEEITYRYPFKYNKAYVSTLIPKIYVDRQIIPSFFVNPDIEYFTE